MYLADVHFEIFDNFGNFFSIVIFPFFCGRTKRRKHLPPKSIKSMCHEPHVSLDKSQSYMSGNMLYPHSITPSNEPNLQQDVVNKESRLLWATLTPHGTRHFVTRGVERYPNYDDHYEVIDYHNRPAVRTREGTPRKIPIKVRFYFDFFR